MDAILRLNQVKFFTFFIDILLNRVYYLVG